MRLAADGNDLQFEFHIMTIGEIAKGADDDGAVAFAGLKRPEAVYLERCVGGNDELDESMRAAGRVHEGKASIIDGFCNG